MADGGRVAPSLMVGIGIAAAELLLMSYYTTTFIPSAVFAPKLHLFTVLLCLLFTRPFLFQ
jgi:hypothetical protein